MSAPPSGVDAGADASPPAKPRLKINVSRSSSFVGDVASAFSAVTPSDGAMRKVKLKISNSQPATPLEKTLLVTKAGRQPKPSRKLVESKKRSRSSDDDDDDDAGGPKKAMLPATKIKLKPLGKSKKMGLLVVKPRGRPPVHPAGDGYDSEASDREDDPTIEEQFVLRMLPGEHCDYIRWCMDNDKIGVPKAQGGADLYMRFFEEESRRGVVTVQGQPFAAVMVDLPTITESMKTWDRKSLMKSADVCQMLLVFAQVRSEEEARHVALPGMLEGGFKWPHGLTPPMHDCVHRRFAKTISRKEIEDKEAEVERLLAEDAKCVSTRWEWVDERREEEEEEEEEGDEDAEGELDDSLYFGPRPEGGEEGEGIMMDNDLEADLEAAFADEFEESPATGGMITPMTAQGTPAVLSIEGDGFGEEEDDEDDEGDDDDDDDEDDEDDEELDEDQKAARDEAQGVKDIIHDLKKQLALRIADFERTQNRILRSRLENQIKQLKSEIQLKQQSIGIEED